VYALDLYIQGDCLPKLTTTPTFYFLYQSCFAYMLA